jgi:pyruvate kinase
VNIVSGAITTLMMPFGDTTDELILIGEKTAIEKKLIKRGDTVIVLAGTTNLRGSTNMMEILKVGS